MIANGPKERNIYVCPLSHYYVHNEEKEKIILVRTLQIESFVLPPFSVFAGNGYVQHVGTEYLGHPSLQGHVCFVPKDIKLADAIEFSCGGNFAIKK